MAPIELISMKVFAVIILICLLLVGTVSAKAASSGIPSSIANPALASGPYLTATIDCSADPASSGTTPSMGELSVSSVPAGASISIDGSPWTVEQCISTHILGDPPHCFPIKAYSPAYGTVNTGIHPIVISKNGYTSYSGNVKICPQLITYIDKTLTAAPATTTTTPTTTVTTTATTTATTTTTAAATTSAVTATATTSAAETATTSAAGTTTTSQASETAMPPGTGSLSVITTPAGAAVYVDGVQRGVSPATIPGLAAGSHTVLLKLDGYKDLSTPVPISAGVMNTFSTGMTPLSADGTPGQGIPATSVPPLPAKTQSPGFEAAAVLLAIGALFICGKNNP